MYLQMGSWEITCSSLFPELLAHRLVSFPVSSAYVISCLISPCHFLSPVPFPVSLLPQGDARTYNYVAALSSDEKQDWEEMMTLAKLIPRICHNVNRWDRVCGSTGHLDSIPFHSTEWCGCLGASSATP